MSKDIRSFFSITNKKTSSNQVSTPNTKKRPVIIESSDEDVPATPIDKPKEPKAKKRKITSSNGSESDISPKSRSKKKDTTPKFKPINASDMFKSSPKLQQESKVKKIVVNVTESDVFSDDDFKATLLQADEEFDKITEEIEEKSRKSEISSKKKNNSTKETIKSSTSKTKSEPSTSKKSNGNSVTAVSSDDQHNNTSVNDESACDISQDIILSTPKQRKRKVEHDETITDEERHEKRRQSAVLYQKFLHRGGPPNPGSKEVPKGKPNCLKGLVFLITGVLESLERDEAASIITDLGGRVIKAISRKVTHVIAGDDAGPAKLEKARSLGIKVISEDELLELIREKSSDLLPVDSSINEKNITKSKESNTNIVDKKTSDEKKHTKTETSPKKIKDKKNKESNGFSSSQIKIENIEGHSKNKKVSPKKSDADEEVSELFKDNRKLNEDNKKNIKKLETNEEELLSKKMVTNGQTKLMSFDTVAWVDKYKPKTVKQIIGQQGENSNVKKLMKWLQNWYKNRNPNLKLAKPSPWAKNDDGAYYKAALLSGSPGVGKTTTANLVSVELGFDVVELNASDTRNKNLLREDVGNLLSNKSLAGYFTGTETGMSKKHVLLMDEVDGMAGNEDRGGMQELIQLIKGSSVPVICMCNDRNHPKIRSLVNYCFDLKFSKPRVEQIRGAMMSVCYKENIKIKPEVLDQIISGTQNDIRQTLNNLSMWVDDNISLETAKSKAENSRKDIKLGPWDVVRKVFSEEEQKKTNIHQKSSLFFHDYSIAPLFVQENYLSVVPHCDKKQWLDRVTEAADYISISDLADSRIRKSGAWSLLPLQAIYSSVAPGSLLSGHFGGQINFPSWLGKNSKRNKFLRMLSELQIHMRLSTSGSLQAVNLDYLPYVRNALINPLQTGNVDDAVQVMQNYHLLREDLENIVELSLWPKQKDPLALVNGKVKAAFTRTYNKGCRLVPSTAIKKRTNIALDQEDELGDENAEVNDNSEEENEDDISKDNTIKTKKVIKNENKDSTSKKKKVTEATNKPKKPRTSKKK